MKKRFLSIVLTLAMIVSIMPLAVLAETYVDENNKLHDSNSEFFTSNFFDWKDLNVTVDNEGYITGISASAWYNANNNFAIYNRDYGFFIAEASQDAVAAAYQRAYDAATGDKVEAGLAAIGNQYMDSFNNLMASGKRIDKGKTGNTYEWLSLSLSQEDCSGMKWENDYNIWIWTSNGYQYNSFESKMGTMSGIIVNRYVKYGAPSAVAADYTLDSTLKSMNIVGQGMNALWKTYGDGILNTTLSNEEMLTSTRTNASVTTYNLYFDYTNWHTISDATAQTEKGTINVANLAAEGDTVEITVTPESGYELDTLTITDDVTSEMVAWTQFDNNTYKFTMPADDVTVKALFKEIHIHDFTGEYKDNGDGTHSQKCSGCDEYGNIAEHTFVDYVCVCGAIDIASAKKDAKQAIIAELGNDTSENVVKAAEDAIAAIESALTIDDIDDAKNDGIEAIRAARNAYCTLEAENDYYMPDEPITFTAKVPVSFNKIGLENEVGKAITVLSSSYVPSETNGYNTWTFTAAVETTGDRTLSLVAYDEEGIKFATGAKDDIIIAKVLPAGKDDVAVIGARVPETAFTNEVFTVNVNTTTTAAKVGIFDAETGKAFGKISQSYVDKNGVRTWTITMKIGSKGTRNLSIKAADIEGNWYSDFAATVVVSKAPEKPL